MTADEFDKKLAEKKLADIEALIRAHREVTIKELGEKVLEQLRKEESGTLESHECSSEYYTGRQEAFSELTTQIYRILIG